MRREKIGDGKRLGGKKKTWGEYCATERPSTGKGTRSVPEERGEKENGKSQSSSTLGPNRKGRVHFLKRR